MLTLRKFLYLNIFFSLCVLNDMFVLPFCVFAYQPTVTGEIQSPMGVASVEFVDPREPVAVSLW